MQPLIHLVHVLTAISFLESCVLRTSGSQQATLQFLGQPPFTARVSHASPPGTTLYTLVAINSSHSTPDAIRYSLVEQSYNSDLFELHAFTGRLVNLQYLPLQTWVLQVLAEAGSDSVEAELTVLVEPDYKILPVFEKENVSFSLSEYIPVGSLFGIVRAFSLNPENRGHSYTIVSGNAGNDIMINATMGILSVARELDHETTPEYGLTVEYSDGAAQARVSMEVEIIDENDNRPHFPKVIYEATVSEKSGIGTSILTISAMDLDSGVNGEIEYSLVDTGRFEIDGSSGKLSTASRLDYEEASEHRFTVVASDGGDPVLTSSVIVVVRVLNEDDECPVFQSSHYSITISPEAIPDAGAVIATVQALDPDNIGDISYSLQSVPPHALSLDPSTGSITLLDPSPNKHTLRVLAIDDTPCAGESSAEVVINVGSTNSHSPRFTGQCVGEVSEGSPPGTVVTTLQATDDDIGIYGNVTFAFVDNGITDFSLNPENGAVSVSGGTVLDYETTNLYLIDVIAKDLSNRQAYCLLNITVLDVNDNAPVFLDYASSLEVSIPEVPSVGMFVVQLLAEDADSGSNGVIDYTLQVDPLDFAIDPTSGVITVASEPMTQSPYVLTVVASNANAFPSMSTSASLTVHLNSNNIAFNQSLYSTTVCENIPVSTSVLQVYSDGGTNQVIYSIVSGSQYSSNGDNVFTIEFDGNIIVSSQANVDHEKLPNTKFMFSVRAVLANSPAIQSIATVEITVLDYDDNPPEFQLDSMGYSVAENSPAGSTVAHVSATDLDSGSNGDIVYSLRFGGDMFRITDSGDILTNTEIDAEFVDLVNTMVIDAENPNPTDPDACMTDQRQSGVVFVTISILDINDNAPYFTPDPTSVTLHENTTLNLIIFTFSAGDDDIKSDSSEIRYSFIGGDTNHNFMLGDGGHLVLIQPLDFEEIHNITLSVQVSDGVNTNTTELTINVLDVDDEQPVFSPTSYSTNITENVPLGTTILQVSAVDVDTASVSYWLTGTAEGRLSINSSGVITVSGNIDREEFQDGIFSFAVVAEGGPLATADVTISIADVNDCAPRFPNIDAMVVLENVSPGRAGVQVGTVAAHDSDTGSNGEIVYTLRSGGENGFTIDPYTGNITAHRMYDREMAASYTLVVEAMDMGEDIQLSTMATFQVEIGDENDNAPHFPFTYMYTRIFENTESGMEVFKLPAVDMDEGSNAELIFTLLSSEPESDQVFNLHQTMGVIRLAKALDYENLTERSFTLTFSVTDSMNETESHASLDIELLDRNDHMPVVGVTQTPLGSEIPEDTVEGTVVLEITASDGDSGANAELVFAIAGGDPSGDFAVTATGNAAVVSVARQLDYETKSSYNFIIRVCDQGIPALCSTLFPSFSIGNIDDVVPSFSQALYRASVVENSVPVISILQVAASDPDFGDSFVYQIESGNDDGRFSINSTSGVLSSTAMLDREEQDTYTLVITAADEGGVPLTGTGTAVITVLDVDDNPPANETQWRVFMLLLNGHLPADHSVDYYFNDPDPTSTFSGCKVIQIQQTGSFFTVDEPGCLLHLNRGNTPVNDYAIRVTATDQKIYSSVEIDVEHISLSDIPTDHLVTVSLAVSSAGYLTNAYTIFPDALSTILEIDRQMLTILSIKDGYHDSTNTVDVSFFAKSAENSYLDPALIIQTLYTQRDRLRSLVGYELSALPTDPCSSEPCAPQASCTPLKTVLGSSVTANSFSFVLVTPVVELEYECECIPGTSGDNCSINFDNCYSDPCHYSAQCIDEVSGYRCVCPPGTSGDDCSVSPNGCSSNPCLNGADCRDIPSSHLCLCLPGYYGSECQYHYFRTAPTCDSGPCQNGGTCSPGRDSFTCLCPDTHSGPLCEIDSVPQGCSGNPCYNGSTCTESDSGPICSCSVGFTGPFCRWQIDNCELEPCLNGGTCATGLYGSYQCYCPLPFTGENCENYIRGCDSSPCMNGGRCSDVSDSSSYTCECKRGFSGDNCEYNVQPLNLCLDGINQCLLGNCTYGRDSFTCSCPANYSGVLCETESPPTTLCASNPCLHGGQCSLLSDSCSCSLGFTGANCETNIDDCSSNPCVYGTCRDGVGGYVCECETEQVTGYHCEVWCPDGLSGDFCQNATSQCDPTLCLNGGTCVEGRGGASCVCPPTHSGPACEQEMTCDTVECFNGGSCSALEDGGYGCVCTDGFDGTNCQLLTVSFTVPSSEGETYRAYPSLHLSAKGRIEFEFSTVDSEGLLLYNTQLQSGESRDFVAVELEGGRLAVGVSHGEDRVRLVPDLWVSDGQWHSVTIDIIEKRTSVTLDWCHGLDDATGTTAGCHISASTLGQSSFLDLGLPLWLGGAPSSSPSHVSSNAITACVRQVMVGGALLDLNSHVHQSNSQPGCPQLEDQCSSQQCGGGDCVPTWTSGVLCDCPPLLSGPLCDARAPSVSYSGSGYAHYTLTEEGVRHSRQTGGQLRSTYEDRVSLTLRTTHTDGFLFGMYGQSEAEYLYIVLESGQVVLHLSLSGETAETELILPSQQLNDSERHSLEVHRSGTHLNLSLDSTSTLQHSLTPGTPLTLETLSSEIYTGGSPFVPVSSWFTGCLQGVRINQVSLPATSAGNEFAGVVYEGAGGANPGVTEDCSLSACYLNPCGSGGMCEETGNGSYQCVCSGGERVTAGVCPQQQELPPQFLPYVISAIVLVLLIIIVSVSVFAGVYVWRRRKMKRTYQVRDKEKMDGQELTDFFAPNQAVIISNEQGGGEVDASEEDWVPMAEKCGSSAGKPSPQSTKSASSKESPASKASSSRASREKREKYRFRLSVPGRGEVDGEGEEGEEDVRSNSPVIRAYLEERVDAANDELLSVDSLRKFEEEGSEDSEVDSLSSAYHSNEGEEEEEEGYTLERLQAAGPPLSSLAPLLQHVLQSTAEISTQVSPSSTSDTAFTNYTTQ